MEPLPVAANAELNDSALERGGNRKERRRRCDYSVSVNLRGRVHGRNVRMIENVIRLGDKLRLHSIPQREDGSGIARIKLVDVGAPSRVPAHVQWPAHAARNAVSIEHLI